MLYQNLHVQNILCKVLTRNNIEICSTIECAAWANEQFFEIWTFHRGQWTWFMLILSYCRLFTYTIQYYTFFITRFRFVVIDAQAAIEFGNKKKRNSNRNSKYWIPNANFLTQTNWGAFPTTSYHIHILHLLTPKYIISNWYVNIFVFYS